MSWRPGSSWPSQAQLTYLAAMVTVGAAALYFLKWLSGERARRASWPVP